MENQIYQFFWVLLVHLPSVITIAACMVFVLTRWKRYPRVSLLAFTGLLLLFLCGLLRAVLSTSSGTNRLLDVSSGFLGLILYTALAIAFTPLLAAIFVRRSPLQKRNVQRL